jgi:hypothetical protein
MGGLIAWTCPKCGKDDGFSYTQKAGGLWVHSFSAPIRNTYSGIIDDGRITSLDLLTEGPMPKKAECFACGEKIPIPNYNP